MGIVEGKGNMERLTREDWKNSNSMMWKKADDLECNDMVKKAMKDVLKKLAEYEDLEEQGKLLKLPCAVGDTVYVLRIDNSAYMMNNEKVWEIAEDKFEIFHFDSIGKTVFLTKESAEAALKELLEVKNSYSQVKVLKSFANE